VGTRSTAQEIRALLQAMRVTSNGLELEYETFGNKEDPAVLLVMGFSQQMIAWEVGFCTQLAARGFQVVRFDNRDVGLSTKLTMKGRPNILAILGGDRSTVPYGIADMADDTAGLIAELGLGAAHVVGVSMGGMIGQTLALRHPERVKSLVSIMSTIGDPNVGQPTPEAFAALTKRPPTERDAYIDHAVGVWRVLRSPGFAYDDARGRQKIAEAYDRSFSPEGTTRQFAAIVTQPDRTQALGALKIPVTVVHGADDPLINRSGGEAMARAVPGARLLVIPGMGHDLPEGVWSLVIDAIVDNAKRA
jgi:pimeloyl-ACP methyl ester carboxylesterase